MAKTNYVNNKDLLKEIHKSKNSFCSYRDAALDSQYDIILSSLSEINDDTIAQAKKTRSARFYSLTGESIPVERIEDTELVFRVMTWEHIPLSNKTKVKKTTKKNTQSILSQFFKIVDTNEEEDDDDEENKEVIYNYTSSDDAIINDQENKAAQAKLEKSKHVKVNFPPFFHYKLNKNGVAYVVGKSHWKGDLDTGEFCKTHGCLTDNLALMIMKLAYKYSMKGNLRGYSYRDEMESCACLQLCQVVLQFNESKSLNPFAFLTTVAKNSYIRVLNLEKKNQQIRDQLLVDAGKNASYTYKNDSVDWNGDGE
jgi:hypothetical protein